MGRIKLILSSLIVIFAFVFVFYFTYNTIEPRAYDIMTKYVLIEKLPFDHNKKVHGSDDIVLVVIDQKSSEKYRWPWKRELYCNLFNYFYYYAKEKVIVHDTIMGALDRDNPESDRRYFRTLKKFDNLITGFMPSTSKWNDEKFGEAFDKNFVKYSVNATSKVDLYPTFKSIVVMPKEYMDSVEHLGSVLIPPGFINGNISKYALDEVTRNHSYIVQYKDKYYPSLPLETFLYLNNNPHIVVTNNSMKFPDLKYEIKHVNNNFFISSPVKFYKPYDTYSHKSYSAIDIMDSYEALRLGKKPLIDPSEFKDKIVIVGANVIAGEGLNDNKGSSVLKKHPGIDLQATAIDNIIHKDFLKVVPMWFNILITILGMLSVYLFIRLCTLTKTIISTLLIISAYLFLSVCCFYFGCVINVITPIVMFVLTTVLAYTHKFILENRSKEKVKSAMGKYMSQDIMKRIVQNIDNLGLGGKKSVVTVLFADIRGFTSMSEQMSAQQVSEILNEYFTEMEPIISKYNGVINKFIGDAVMAIFGEPIQDKNHAQNAVKCAYAMLTKVKELQKKWIKEGKPKIEIGVGINTGEVFVGNIGSINRMEYTVIGDTVNLASRLESYNKIYKTKLLISSTTYEEVKGYTDVIKISDVQIRGKANKMDIYEVLKVKMD